MRISFRSAVLFVPALLAGLAVVAGPVCGQSSDAKTAAEMKPYTETIPGTEIKFDLLPIPGGSYKMGSPESEEGRQEDEGPQVEVTIKPFWMGKYEVTWDEYDQFAFSLDIKRRQREGIDIAKITATDKIADAVTRPTPPYADMTFGYGHDKQPAICMTHHAAMEYTRWISAKTGRSYRLPTEAEWEWACRAGTKTAYSFGDDASKIDDYAWNVNNAEKPMPVGKKKPNPWGLHDMHGNVAEWVFDHYDAKAYAKAAKSGDVVNMPDDKEYPYIVRGGSYDDDPEMLRSATRRSSDREWSVQDPQRPQSIWWHTDAHWAGIRVIRPLDGEDALAKFKSPVVKRGATR